MTEKILRITFNGICTLTPGDPPCGETVEKVFVLMPGNRDRRRNNWDADVEPHAPFIYVPESIQFGQVPTPADSVNDDKFGKCNIYYVNDAKITVKSVPELVPGIQYYIDKRKNRTFENKERPGSDDVVSEHDMRWLMNVRDVVPEARVKDDAKPLGATVVPQLAVAVELTSGLLKASFPCKSVQPKTFASPNGEIPNFRRVLATEFFIEIKFPDDTTLVSLRLDPLAGRTDKMGHAVPASGVPGDALFLQWGDRTTIDVRMGNDTKDEARALRSFRRCDARSRTVDGRPVAVPRDEDFDLHYDLMDHVGSRPLPQTGPYQTHVDVCDPVKG